MAVVQPTHRLAQLSDLHLTADDALLYGGMDTTAQLDAAIARLTDSGLTFDAVILSGDLTDTGALDAYQRLRVAADRLGEILGCPVLAGLGNHDVREPFHQGYEGGLASDRPADDVIDLNGLRVINLDSSVPGAAHGEISDGQLEWLHRVLATPAPHGSVLVVHHPPIPTSSALMAMVELVNPDALGEVIAGTDVRIILSGHMHTTGTSSLRGIPISICGGVSYAADPLFGDRGYRAMQAGQSIMLIEFIADAVVTTSVPIEDYPTLHEIDAEALARILGR